MSAGGWPGVVGVKQARLTHAREITDIERVVNEAGGEATIAEIVAIMSQMGWQSSAQVAARVEEERIKAVKEHEAEAERRLTAKYHAALPVFVRDPGVAAHWPMTSLRAAQDCAERARWEEREACAALCDASARFAAAGGPHNCDTVNGALWYGRKQYAEECAKAIRARGTRPSQAEGEGRV
ncbi:hypothetical protein [Roseomonas chloroacetimidivorans]|uniref:hypothetical protein n=1 Tax=Roseomonas chloroacetimidivorans TaxID=1766656 RepID=UPI003C73267D